MSDDPILAPTSKPASPTKLEESVALPSITSSERKNPDTALAAGHTPQLAPINGRMEILILPNATGGEQAEPKLLSEKAGVEHDILVEGGSQGFRIIRASVGSTSKEFVLEQQDPKSNSPNFLRVTAFSVHGGNDETTLKQRDGLIVENLSQNLACPPIHIVSFIDGPTPSALSVSTSPQAWSAFHQQRDNLQIECIDFRRCGPQNLVGYQLKTNSGEVLHGQTIYLLNGGSNFLRERNNLLQSTLIEHLEGHQGTVSLASRVENLPHLTLAANTLPKVYSLLQLTKEIGVGLRVCSVQDSGVSFEINQRAAPQEKTNSLTLTHQQYQNPALRDQLLAKFLRAEVERLHPGLIPAEWERKEKLVDQLTREHQNISSDFRESSRYAMSLLPEKLLIALKEAGIVFHLKHYPTQDDVGVMPVARGRFGPTQRNNTGGYYYFDKRMGEISEKTLNSRGEWVPQPYIGETLIHEVGHAVDHLMGEKAARLGGEQSSLAHEGISSSAKFRDAYYRDWQRLPERHRDERGAIGYFLQPGTDQKFVAGRQEAFAEAFQTLFGQPMKNNEMVFEKRFPYWTECLRHAIQGEYLDPEKK